VNNTTLLHFLEKTIVKHFPDMEIFLEELAKPAEAYRVNLQESRKSLAEIRQGLLSIHQELENHHLNPEEMYSKLMWSFYGRAKHQVADLVDEVNEAESIFSDVLAHYGEDDKNMSSSEFYGIFKTFVTSYKKCKADNDAIIQEQLAVEKRKLAAEESRTNRQRAQDQVNDDSAVLDNLLERLRNGDNVGKRVKRARPQAENVTFSSSQHISAIQEEAISKSENDTVDIARDMLARLQSDGFVTALPATPVIPPRKSRKLWTELNSEDEVNHD
jgi:cytokinesis protein